VTFEHKPQETERQAKKNFFAIKLQFLKSMKLDTTRAFDQNMAKLMEPSYELSLLIAKAKESSHDWTDTCETLHHSITLVTYRGHKKISFVKK
jgi:hypothetical protein